MKRNKVRWSLRKLADDIVDLQVRIGTYQYGHYKISINYNFGDDVAPEYYARNEKQRKQYHERSLAGLCVRCGRRKSLPNEKRCKQCKIKQNRSRHGPRRIRLS